ncbi:hypothetical protein CHUAL_012527 [Chamberlinius hualienensis]
MACGGFTCSKNALIGLNILYILVAFILIAVAAYGQTANYFANISLVGGIIACGVFLLLISILGLLGAIRHHQVLLFFYMVILFLLFLIQFSIACACLAVNHSQQEAIAKKGWQAAAPSLKMKVQEHYQCCGFDYEYRNVSKNDTMRNPDCYTVGTCCTNIPEEICCNSSSTNPAECGCDPCKEQLTDVTHSALRGSGGIGLFFSFAEFIGVWLTVRYRNQKDPRANPRDFI